MQAFAGGGFTRAEIDAMISSRLDLPPSSRLEIFSRKFMGIAYMLDGLGEGPKGKYDRDPLYRFDGFDCTTFVETATAMALSRDFNDFERQLQQLRYEHGEISYVLRNHFPSADWIPNNIASGFLEEITADVAGPDVPVLAARALVDKPSFYAKKTYEELNVPGATPEEKLRLLDEWRAEGLAFNAQDATLPYIALKDLFAGHGVDVLNRIPHGAIINIVRPGWNITDPKDGSLITQMNVSHQGLAFWRNGVLYLRHASKDAGKVSELPLADYLRRFINHATIRGFNVLKIRR